MLLTIRLRLVRLPDKHAARGTQLVTRRFLCKDRLWSASTHVIQRMRHKAKTSELPPIP